MRLKLMSNMDSIYRFYFPFSFQFLKLYVWQLWNITTLAYEVDPEPFGRGRDDVVQQMSELAGVEIVSHVSHTLYDTEE